MARWNFLLDIQDGGYHRRVRIGGERPDRGRKYVTLKLARISTHHLLYTDYWNNSVTGRTVFSVWVRFSRLYSRVSPSLVSESFTLTFASNQTGGSFTLPQACHVD